MDAGLALVDHLYLKMRIDDEWSVRDSRGFTWWAGPLAQRIWADRPINDLGMTVGRVHARTEMLEGLASDKEAVIAGVARFATMSGPLIGEGHLLSGASLFVHDQTVDFWKTPFTLAALIQVASAYIDVEGVADLTSSRPAVSSHPTSGSRDNWDEMLEVISKVIAPLGAKESSFIGDGFNECERHFGRQLSVLTNADQTGLTAEFPFVGSTALFRMITDVPNPRLGNGLMCILTLPSPYPSDELAGLALQLNRSECSEVTRAQFLGSWCPDPTQPGLLSFISFLPNMSFFPGIQNLLYQSAASRVKWAQRTIPVLRSQPEKPPKRGLLSFFDKG